MCVYIYIYMCMSCCYVAFLRRINLCRDTISISISKCDIE